jgi:hypothetical protein
MDTGTPVIDYPQDGESYTNGVYYPDLPQERKEEESKDNAVIAASYPVMESVAQWFQEQVEATDSRRNIRAYAEASNLDLTDTARAFDIVHDLLEAKSHEFEVFRSK